MDFPPRDRLFWLERIQSPPTVGALPAYSVPQPEAYTCLGGWSACVDRAPMTSTGRVDLQSIATCNERYRYCQVTSTC